jgi:hypothetical protein
MGLSPGGRMNLGRDHGAEKSVSNDLLARTTMMSKNPISFCIDLSSSAWGPLITLASASAGSCATDSLRPSCLHAGYES